LRTTGRRSQERDHWSTVASHIRLFARLWADQRRLCFELRWLVGRCIEKVVVDGELKGIYHSSLNSFGVTVVGSSSETCAEATMIKVLNLTESRKINASASSKMINYLVWGQSQVRLSKSPPRSRRVAPRRLEVALISLHQVLVFMHYVDRLDDSNHVGNLGSCRWYSGLVLSPENAPQLSLILSHLSYAVLRHCELLVVRSELPSFVHQMAKALVMLQRNEVLRKLRVDFSVLFHELVKERLDRLSFHYIEASFVGLNLVDPLLNCVLFYQS